MVCVCGRLTMMSKTTFESALTLVLKRLNVWGVRDYLGTTALGQQYLDGMCICGPVKWTFFVTIILVYLRFTVRAQV